MQTLTSRALSSHLASAPRVVYSGVDPSADSLHVGNLLPLLTLAHFARFQHTPIVLVGGATGSIGDPSGRSSERNALDKATVERNVAGITSQLRMFFANVASFYRDQNHELACATTIPQGKAGVELGMGVRLMNNFDWMSGVSLLTFLSDVGRHARLTQMLARDSVASRLTTTGLSYTEFSYQLLQAYDFSFLHSHHACTVQVGGSDQLGNITAGIDLIRRQSRLAHDPAYGLTLPLLTTHSGDKFGKSAGNAVWLSAGKTADLEFYQFFLRASDADVGKYLRCLTLLRPEEVEAVMREHETDPKRRGAQRMLADHMTRLIRGSAAMDKCRVLTRVLFSHSRVPQEGGVREGESAAKEALAELQVDQITEQDNILTRMEKEQVVGTDVTRLVVAAGLVKSRGEAKRLLSSGGLYVNNRQVGAEGGVAEDDLVAVKQGAGRVCLLRAGKSAVRVVLVK